MPLFTGPLLLTCSNTRATIGCLAAAVVSGLLLLMPLFTGPLLLTCSNTRATIGCLAAAVVSGLLLLMPLFTGPILLTCSNTRATIGCLAADVASAQLLPRLLVVSTADGQASVGGSSRLPGCRAEAKPINELDSKMCNSISVPRFAAGVHRECVRAY